MKEKRIFIGIDPGVQTGIAVWDSELKKFVILQTTKIHTGMDIVKNLKDNTNLHLIVYLENPNTYIGWESRERRT